MTTNDLPRPQLLKEIEKLKNERKRLDEFTNVALENEQLKMERARIQEAISENWNTIKELKKALKQSRTLERLKKLNHGVEVAPEDVIHESVTVKSTAVKWIVGKNKSSIQRIEESSGTVVKVTHSDDQTANISLEGFRDGVSKAKQMVEDLGNSQRISIPLSRGLVGLLLADKATLLQEMEYNHTVFANLDREQSSLSVFGTPGQIEKVKEEIQRMEGMKSTVTLDLKLLPGVIGRKGENFQKIQSATGVKLDTEKQNELSKAMIHIYGLSKEDIDQGERLVRQVMEENTEIEEKLEVEDGFIGYLLENERAVLRQVMRDYKIHLSFSSERALEDPERRVLILRGTRAHVEEAILYVKSVIEQFHQRFSRRTVSPGVGSLVKNSVDKIKEDSGADVHIKFPRDKDKVHCTITVRGEPEQVTRATEILDSLTSSFVNEELSVPAHVVPALLGSKGNVLKEIRHKSNCEINLDSKRKLDKSSARPDDEPARVTIVGSTEQVHEAKKLVLDIVDQNHRKPISFSCDDAVGALIGKHGKNIATLRKKYPNVHIDVNREKKIIMLHGRSSEVEDAENEIKTLIEDFENKNYSMRVDPSMILSLIGKQGAIAKQLTASTNCQFSFDKENGIVRIHGEPGYIPEAIKKVKELTGQDKDVEEMHLGDDPSVLGSIMGKGGHKLRELEESCNVRVAVNRGANSVTIRGELDNITRAKKSLRKQLRETYFDFKVPTNLLDNLYGKHGSALRTLREATGCEVNVPPKQRRTSSSVEVSVRGPSEGAGIVKKCLRHVSDGKGVFAIPLLSRQIKQLVDNDSRNVEKIKRENHVELEPISCIFTEEDGKPASLGCLAILGDQSTISKTESALEGILKFYFEESFMTVSAPSQLIYEMIHDGKSKAKKENANSKPVGLETTENGSEQHSALSLSTIQEHSNAVVYVSYDASYIVLAGPSSQAVHDARNLIDKQIAWWARTHAEIPVEPLLIHRVLDDYGKEVAKNYNVKIYADRSLEPPLIKVSGSNEENTQSAVQKVKNCIEELGQVMRRVPLPNGAYGVIIGPQGKTVRQLEHDSHCVMGIDKSQGDLKIIGPSEEAVNKGYELVAEKLKENSIYMDEASETVEIPRYAISSIVGKGGETIRNLQDKTASKISIDRHTGLAHVQGAKDAVKAAIDSINSILHEQNHNGPISQEDNEAKKSQTDAGVTFGQDDHHQPVLEGERVRENRKETKNSAAEVSVLDAAEHEIQKNPPPSVPVGFGGQAPKQTNSKKKSKKGKKQVTTEVEEPIRENATDSIMHSLLSATRQPQNLSTEIATHPPPPGFDADSPQAKVPQASSKKPNDEDDPLSVFSSLLRVSDGTGTSAPSASSQSQTKSSEGYYVSKSGVPIRL